MRRRDFLRAGGLGIALTAGCLDSIGETSTESGTKQFEMPTEAPAVPAIAGNLGIVGARGTLTAFDTADEAIKWQTEDSIDQEQPAIAGEAVYVATKNEVIAFQ